MSAETRTPPKAWPDLKHNRQKWNRSLRYRARRAVMALNPHDPDASEGALTEKHRHVGKWDCW